MFRDLKLYKEIVKGSMESLILVLKEYFESERDIFITDPENGETFIHHIVNHAEKYSTPQKVSLIYLFGYAPFDLDRQNINGDTALHIAVRKKGAYRILIALMRCGADPEVSNNEGKTPADILIQDKPDGWQEMLHWLNKFKPGLYRAVTAATPNKKLIERLLRYWCRVTMVKNQKVINLKCLAHCSKHQLDLVYLLEKYENTIEFAMAMLSGKVCSIKSWEGQAEFWSSVDINAKDYSYQYQFPDYPEVPQPLLAAVWEINSFETVDHLMTLNPKTSLPYNPGMHKKPRPLFFHILDDKSRDTAIINRVLKDCDLTYKDYNGRTILHEAVINQTSPEVVTNILNLDVNVAERDRFGQTARNLATSLNRNEYSTLIDEYVLRYVRDCNILKIESLGLASYDYITNITDKKGLTAADLAKGNSSKQLTELIDKIPKTQESIKKFHFMAAKGSIDFVKKILLRCKRVATSADKCGRNVLHLAALHRHSVLVSYISKEYPHTLNSKDNLGRTPLHYAYLFLSPDCIAIMVSQGADKTSRDYSGASPIDYSDRHTINQRRNEVFEFDLDVFICETNFEATFLDSIKDGDIHTVQKLTRGLKEHGGLHRFSKLLFDCLDYGQLDIANYLIQSGFETDIYKQYEHCSPDNPLCAMMECSHGVTSFTQRVLQVKADNIQSLLEKRKKQRAKVSSKSKEALRDNKVKLVNVTTLQAR